MKNIRRTLSVSLLAFIFLTNICHSQSKVDAYRLSYQGIGFGARSLGLGTAYTGIANDFSAVYWNPAGLGQIRSNEVSMGISHLSYGNTSTFIGEEENFSNSGTNLNNVGLVYPFPVSRGSMVLAIGYGRQTDFTSALGFHGFDDSSQTIMYVPELEQRAKILEDGGLDNWIIAGAIEAVRGLYIGLSLNFISGSYTYNKNYSETDIYDRYYPFYGLQGKFIVDEDIGGFTGRLGILHEFRNRKGSVGINIKFPSYLSMREDYVDDLDYLDDDPAYDTLSRYTGISEFDIKTPFVFSAGISYRFGELMLSGSIDYTDWTQMEFRDTYTDLLDENTKIKETFEPTVNVRAGAEFAVPETDLRVRAGFAYLPSPYTFDSSPNAQKFVTGGFGWIIDKSFCFDVGYAYGFWETDNDIYYATVAEKIRSHNVIATASYRF